MKQNTKQSGMIMLNALASSLLVITLSSIVIVLSGISYLREQAASPVAPNSAPIMSLSSLSADLGAFKHLIVTGPTELNGDVFIQGEKLDLASLKGDSYTSDSPKLVAGDGITIDGLTITNSAPNRTQNTFEKIKVSNNEIDTLFGASNGDDTLTFVAGGNINIASDTTNKKLTISGTATGWLLSGSNVHLSDSTYNVGIGTTTPTAKLDVNGTLAVSGATTFTSTLDASGAVTFNSTLNVSEAATFDSTLSASGQGTFTQAPTQAHTGTWAIGSLTWNASDASIYINPASAVADSNLLGVSVNDSVKFSIDAEGDIYGRSLILVGTTTTGTTDVVGDLTVEGNTILGDASSDTVTFNSATHTYANDTNLVLSGGVNGLSFDTDTLSIDATNNRVGIGTTAPSSIFHIATSGDSNLFVVDDDTDQISIGAAVPAPNRKLWVNQVDTDTTSDGSTTGHVAIETRQNMMQATNNSVNGTGLYGVIWMNSPVSFTGSNVAVRGNAYTIAQAGGASVDVSSLSGVYGRVRHEAAGTITEAIGLLADANENAGSGTLTRSIGLKLESQGAGASNYQIYSLGTAPSYFAGSIQLATNTSLNPLTTYLGSSATNGIGFDAGQGTLLTSTANLLFQIDSDNNDTVRKIIFATDGDQFNGGQSAEGTTLGTFDEAGQLALPVTGSSAGLLLGGDTQLYRSAANSLSLASGDSLIIESGEVRIRGNGTQRLWFDKTDNGVDEKKWDFTTTASTFIGRALNDAEDSATTWLTTTRSGTTITGIDLAATTVTIPGSGGLTLGGDVNLSRGAADRLDLASGDSLRIVSGDIQFGTGGTYLINSSAQATFSNITASGTVYLGTDDTSRAALALYGQGTGQTDGGRALFYFSADYDTTADRIDIGTVEDDLRIELSNGTDLALFKSEGQLQLPTTGSGAGLLIGGDFQIYRLAADFGYTPDTFQVGGAFQVDGVSYFPATSGAGSGLVIGGDVNVYRGAASRLDLASGDSFNIVSGDLIVNSDDLFVQQSTGNVGIGTTTPTTFKLQVAGDIGPDTAPTEASDSIESPDTTGDVGKFTSMALDASGFPVIAYADVTSPGLKILHCGNANCTSGNSITTPDADVSWRARNVSLQIDDSGNPAVAYRSADGNLKVLRCGNANCASGNTITPIAITGADLYTVALVLNGSDFPVMAYMSGATAELKILTCGNTTCSSGNATATPDATVNTGYFADIKLDSSGFPVVAYRAVPSGSTLKLLHCGNAGCTSGNSINTLDTDSDTAYWISLALDSSGFPVISYKYQSGGDLKIARCSDANCAGVTITTPDTTDAGSYTSIVLDSSGFPVVAHYAANTLKILHCGNANCTSGNSTTSPDTTGDNVGAYTAMALDSSGFPVVSYQDATNLNLKVLHCASANCGTTGYIGGSNLGSSSTYFNKIYAATFFGKSTTISSFDLAEEYYSTDALEAGEIVSVYTGEGERDDQVSRTTGEYEQATIGIVSTEPGITLANWQQKDRTGMYPIALAGRVPVKVSTENGPIKAGDAITSSSIPGVGMKATKAGRIVGTALQSYNGEGIGSVIVFVNPSYFLGTALAQTVSDDPLFSILDAVGVINTQYQGQILSSNQVQKLINEQSAVLGISTEQTSSVSAHLVSLSENFSLFEESLNSQKEAIASISATLANLPVINLTQFATGSAVLGITIVEEDFAVSGNTTLANLNTIGNVVVANNLTLASTSINTIGEDLQIQPLKQGNVSFMNGLVTVDILGNIELIGNVHADSITLTKDKTVGYSTIPAGAISVTINTTALDTNSQIFVTPITPTHNKIMYISDKQYGESFTVSIDGDASTEEIGFGWLIIGAKP